MKTAIPFALVGALMISPAFGAGSDKSSSSSMSGTGSQANMSGMDQQTVMQVQQHLKQQGYDVGAVDGKMGPQTKQALQNFQRDKNIQSSGQLNQQTMAALGMLGNQRADSLNRSGAGSSPAISPSQQAETPAMRGAPSDMNTNRMNSSSGGNSPGGTGITSTPGGVPSGASNVPGGTGSGPFGSGAQQGPSPRSDSLPVPAR